MEHSKNKTTTNKSLNLSSNTKKGKKISKLVEKLFEDTFYLFMLSSDFTSALWYTNLLNKFKNIKKSNKSDFTLKAVNIYKELFTKQITLKKS